MSDHTTNVASNAKPEEWRDIPGYETLYQVSNLGNVRRLAKVVKTKGGWTQTHHGKNKSLGTRNGYFYLWLFRDNIGKKFYVHELVALAFIGPRPAGCQIHHIDENRLNNHPRNLQYIKKREHSSHHNRGENGNSSTITNTDVASIRRLYKTMPVYAIARELNLSYHVVWQVANRKTWKHLP